MTFHDDGMNAQSPATLRTTRGFSAKAVKMGLARTRCSQTVSSSRTNCVGTMTGSSRFGPPGATRCPKDWATTKERHSLSPRVASTGAMYMGSVCPSGASAGGDAQLVHRLGAVALVVHLSVGRPADGGDCPHAAGCFVGCQLVLDVGDQLRLGGLPRVRMQFNDGHDLLAVDRVGQPHHDRVAHG